MTAGKKTHWLRTTLAVLIACGIAGTVLAGILFFKDSANRTAANMSLQFTFEGASEGKAPNGMPFDVSGLASEPVLTAALEKAAMADRYTAEQLQPCLTMTGDYPEDAVEQMTGSDSVLDFSANKSLSIGDYRPTLFHVSLYNDFDPSVSRTDLEALLRNVLEAYREQFTATYAIGSGLENYFDLLNVDGLDYAEQAALLRHGLEILGDYAAELAAKDPAFRSEDKGFGDIVTRVRMLKENELSRLEANVTVNGLTRDAERVLTVNGYGQEQLNRELARKKQELQDLEKLISSYDKNETIYLSAANSVKQIGGNTSETYDELVLRRNAVTEEITALNSGIDALKQDRSRLTGDQPVQAEPDDTEPQEAVPAAEPELPVLSEAERDVLDVSVAEIVARRDQILSDFENLIRVWSGENNGTDKLILSVEKYDSPTLLSGAFIVRAIKTAGPFCAVGFIVCLILLIIERKKKI